MPDYQQGKIYMIWSPNTDKVYIGSTVQPLHKRFHEHKRRLTGQKSYRTANEVLACGNARIELIEDYPCANKAELNRREGQIMREYDKRVNQLIAGRTAAEYRADNREKLAAQRREYNAKNKEQIAARARERHEQNREQIATQKKEYQQRPEVKARRAAWDREYNAKNKERIVAYLKEYQAKNRERLAAQQKEYRQTPEVKARRNAQAREYRQRKKEQQHTASA